MRPKHLSAEEKGKFAESMVVNMFQASGRRIYNNGIEKTNSDFYFDLQEKKKQGNSAKYDDRLRQLMSKSDYIVENLNGNYDFVEIKFRSIHHLDESVSDDLIHYMNLEKHFHNYKKFWKPYVILVTTEPLEDTGMFTVIVPPYTKKENGTMNYPAASREVSHRIVSCPLCNISYSCSIP